MKPNDIGQKPVDESEKSVPKDDSVPWRSRDKSPRSGFPRRNLPLEDNLKKDFESKPKPWTEETITLKKTNIEKREIEKEKLETVDLKSFDKKQKLETTKGDETTTQKLTSKTKFDETEDRIIKKYDVTEEEEEEEIGEKTKPKGIPWKRGLKKLKESKLEQIKDTTKIRDRSLDSLQKATDDNKRKPKPTGKYQTDETVERPFGGRRTSLHDHIEEEEKKQMKQVPWTKQMPTLKRTAPQVKEIPKETLEEVTLKPTVLEKKLPTKEKLPDVDLKPVEKQDKNKLKEEIKTKMESDIKKILTDKEKKLKSIIKEKSVDSDNEDNKRKRVDFLKEVEEVLISPLNDDVPKNEKYIMTEDSEILKTKTDETIDQTLHPFNKKIIRQKTPIKKSIEEDESYWPKEKNKIKDVEENEGIHLKIKQDEYDTEPTNEKEDTEEERKDEKTLPWKRGKKPSELKPQKAEESSVESEKPHQVTLKPVKRPQPKQHVPEQIEKVELKPVVRVKHEDKPDEMEKVELKPVEREEPEEDKTPDDKRKPKQKRRKLGLKDIESPDDVELEKYEPFEKDDKAPEPKEEVKVPWQRGKKPDKPVEEDKKPEWTITRKPKTEKPEEDVEFMKGKRRPKPEEEKETIQLKPFKKDKPEDTKKDDDSKPIKFTPKPSDEGDNVDLLPYDRKEPEGEKQDDKPLPWRCGKKPRVPSEDKPEEISKEPEKPHQVTLKPVKRPQPKEHVPEQIEKVELKPVVKVKHEDKPEEMEKVELKPVERDEPEEDKTPDDKRKPKQKRKKPELKDIESPDDVELEKYEPLEKDDKVPEPKEEVKVPWQRGKKPEKPTEEDKKPEWTITRKPKPEEKPEEDVEFMKGKRRPKPEEEKETVQLKPFKKDKPEDTKKDDDSKPIKFRPKPSDEQPEQVVLKPIKRPQPKEVAPEEVEKVELKPVKKIKPDEKPKSDEIIKSIVQDVVDEEKMESESIVVEQTKKVIKKILKKPKEELPTPPRFIERLQPVVVNPGKPAVFVCKVEGQPFPNLSWYHSEVELFPSENYVMTLVDDTATLEIIRPEPQHVGMYSCRASNPAGVATSTANFIILGTLIMTSFYQY